MSEARDELWRDAELVIDVCMSVGSGDVVTIITDDEHSVQASVLGEVAAARGALPVIANNGFQVRRALRDTRYPMDPPRNLHRAMVASDEVIIVTDLEWANRFAHVSAVKETCASNGKIASVEGGMGAWGLSADDIRLSTERARQAIRALAQARWVRVTSPAGTDVVVHIEGRPALEVTPIKQRGQMMGPIPLWAEVAFAAVEDKTEGRIVIDGIMMGIGVKGHVTNPIVLEVRGGRVVSIEGGDEARKLREVISGVQNADVIGEFAFGTSHRSPFGSPSEKGRLGTVHFALGDNHNAYPGGRNVSVLHLDGVCLNATLQIEDSRSFILRDGEWSL
jgi:leucyl aminopeptidase (aminopeptidase T)